MSKMREVFHMSPDPVEAGYPVPRGVRLRRLMNTETFFDIRYLVSCAIVALIGVWDVFTDNTHGVELTIIELLSLIVLRGWMNWKRIGYLQDLRKRR
jgi:hypothetical protein